ncbi:hypothetical protein [Streptomyces daghestanicus]|jgi:hypothetical protein|uniref:Uncharacterized protein n=1 Tax=Streptomyces daghestanicus TaxID=66885 RepID=A0ABQ3Q7M2_9ACTN|nr:hypothetical protein [Streptomyces daghestanicus]GGU69097.1 hypothetical protein GCM10010259_68690 [Streptomyces daghestanicus]GHI33251.1 hypothetical protein Sdagh_49810 [Streptomyces daghestanicus]
MRESVLSAAHIVLTLALLTWMITGFTPLPGRWLRWKMFCRATFTIVQLTGTKDGHAEPVNVYDHLSPGSFILGPPQLKAILDHLTNSGQYDRIDGTGRVLSARGEQPVKVVASRVVL